MSIPHDHRLRKHAEFELVYQCGRRHFSPVLTAFYVLRSVELPPTRISELDTGGTRTLAEGARVGITVGRALGKATVRNRIKRRVRAAVTQNLSRLTRPVDVVINPKKVVLEAEFQQLCSELARAFDVIEQKAAPASEQDTQQQQRTERRRLAAKKT
jgi:ribonuclease P protein component